jgi:hypothetical protein
MIGLTTRANRSMDFGLLEAVPAFVLIAALFVGGDWVGEAADDTDAQRAQHGHAIAMAMGSSNALMGVPFEELEPTEGFVPMPAHLVPSIAAPGEIDVTDPGYAFEVRITDLDAQGRLRRLEVRVGYDAESGDRAWVGMATVRQDWAASHADAQPETRRDWERFAS